MGRLALEQGYGQTDIGTRLWADWHWVETMGRLSLGRSYGQTHWDDSLGRLVLGAVLVFNSN